MKLGGCSASSLNSAAGTRGIGQHGARFCLRAARLAWRRRIANGIAGDGEGKMRCKTQNDSGDPNTYSGGYWENEMCVVLWVVCCAAGG
jgi:hypothetical protein